MPEIPLAIVDSCRHNEGMTRTQAPTTCERPGCLNAEHHDLSGGDYPTVTKVTLRGPIPYGGTYTSTTDDPTVARLIAAGYTVSRTWPLVSR